MSAFDVAQALAELAALRPILLTDIIYQRVEPPKLVTENDSNPKSDAELNLTELRAEMDRIRELIKQKRLNIKQNLCSISDGSEYIRSLQERSRSLLQRADALVLASGRPTVTLPTEILINICSLAYEPRERMRSLADGHFKTVPGDLWDEICCMVIPDIVHLGVNWPDSTETLRRALDASEPSKLHIFVGHIYNLNHHDLIETALEYQHRWNELTIYYWVETELEGTLKQCAKVLPLLRKLKIAEQHGPMPSTFELWGMTDHLPRSPRIQSACSPSLLIGACRALYSNLIHLSVHVCRETNDIGELRTAFHGLHSLKTLKILPHGGYSDNFETYLDHEVLPNPQADVLPNLKDLVIASDTISPGYVKCILQCIPSHGLQMIVADFCKLGRKVGPRETLTTILKKAIELIELVDTRYPNLSHISVVAGQQYGYNKHRRREHWVVRGLIKFLSKPTSKDQWILPRLKKLTLPFSISMMSNLVDLTRQREENMSTLSLDVVEFREQYESVDYGAIEGLSAYVHDVVIVRSDI